MAGTRKEPRMKNIRITNQKDMLNTGTGEINTILSESSFKSPVEPNYVKMYLEDIATLHRCTRPEIDVLIELLKLMDYKNIVYLPSGVKKVIAKALELQSVNWINVCIVQLVNKRVMDKQENGVYIVNPIFFAKGAWKEIREIQFTATWNAEGRTVTAQKI